jgi:hypothetical protein
VTTHSDVCEQTNEWMAKHVHFQKFKLSYTTSSKRSNLCTNLFQQLVLGIKPELTLLWEGWYITPTILNNNIYGTSPACHYLRNWQSKRKVFKEKPIGVNLFRHLWANIRMNGQGMEDTFKNFKHHPLLAIVRNNLLKVSLGVHLLNFFIRSLYD